MAYIRSFPVTLFMGLFGIFTAASTYFSDHILSPAIGWAFSIVEWRPSAYESLTIDAVTHDLDVDLPRKRHPFLAFIERAKRHPFWTAGHFDPGRAFA